MHGDEKSMAIPTLCGKGLDMLTLFINDGANASHCQVSSNNIRLFVLLVERSFCPSFINIIFIVCIVKMAHVSWVNVRILVSTHLFLRGPVCLYAMRSIANIFL